MIDNSIDKTQKEGNNIQKNNTELNETYQDNFEKSNTQTINNSDTTEKQEEKRVFFRPPIVKPINFDEIEKNNSNKENLDENLVTTENSTNENTTVYDEIQKKSEETIEKEVNNQSTDITVENIKDNVSEITLEEEIENETIIEPIHEPSLVIVPTAHISEESVKTVRETIYEKKPELVAIELDTNRYNTLINEKLGIKREEKLDLKKALKTNNLTITVVSSVLAHMQQKMGNEVGVKPGSEMIEAAKIASEVNANVALIDRDIQVTLKRTIKGMSWREKLSFIWAIIKSFFMGDDEEEQLKEEVEELKQEDTIEEAMNLFKEASPGGYNAMVHERDAYMAYNLKSLENNNVVAVVGAGHKNGILEYLTNPDTIPPIDELNQIKEPRISISKILLYLIPILFVVIFVIAYMKGINIEGGLLNFLIFAGGGAFIGSILSGSKIQSALVAFIVAPVTVLHPLLAAGWFSGIVEGKLRHVGMKDVHQLSDCETLRDFWHNKLVRVIVVVIGTNLGCSIGFLLVITNVFLPYLSMIWG